MAVKRFRARISTRGQLFSMIALMMSLFFIVLFSGVTRVPLDGGLESTTSEILYLNDVVLDLDDLVISAAESSTLLILNFSINHLDGTNYFPSFPEFFNSCFINGSFYDYSDTTWKVCSLTGKNVSFLKLIEETFYLSGNVHNLDINVSNVQHTMSLYDAYSLEVIAEMDLHARLRSQKKNVAWDREVLVSSQIDFNGIKDPASLGTAYERYIKHRPGERTFARVSFFGNETLVGLYLDNTYYYVDQTGPSFFERMQGNKTETFDLNDSNSYGIATFMPAHDLVGNSLYLENISMVDHHYDWGATPQASLLRFFDAANGINPNVTMYRTYMIQGMGFEESDLERVETWCNEDGCKFPP